MIHPIVKWGDPVLEKATKPVEKFDEELQKLVDEMFESMYAAQGVGLAAPQVGLSERVFVIDLSVGKSPADLIALVNPAFIRRDGMQLEEEGCLSVPGFHATVARPLDVVIRGLDRHGHERTIEAHGLLARALQHEMDHLDGILFIDRLKPVHHPLADAARIAGVSPAAPYRHFRDRDELLSSIAERGFEQFESALTEAWDDGRPDTVSAFERVGKAKPMLALAKVLAGRRKAPKSLAKRRVRKLSGHPPR